MNFLVIDGNSILNRAFYGIKVLTTKDGRFTNAIYGFLNIFLRLKEECDPEAIAVAFDVKHPTFRHEMYDGYKATRKGMPEELAQQMPVLKELLRAMGVVVVEKPGFEADDILGTLSKHCGENNKCFIATGDRDSLQLVRDNVNVLLASTKMGRPVTVRYTPEEVKEKYGVEPPKLIDIKALMGDSSDNIPGVAGIGEKTAGDLISRFSNIEYIYDNIETIDVRPAVRTKLQKDKEMAFLSKQLGTINCDIPIDLDIENYKIGECDNFKVTSMLADLEMFKIIERLGLEIADAAKVESEDVKPLPVFEETDTDNLMQRITADGECYFLWDKEDCFFNFGDKVVFIKCENESFYPFFMKMLESKKIKKYTRDIKDIYSFAVSCGFEANSMCGDIELEGYVLNPSAKGYEILKLAGEYGAVVPTEEGSFGEEAACLRKLFEKMNAEIEKNNQQELLNDIELPLARVLSSMETVGFDVDADGIEKFGKELAERIDLIEDSIYSMVGYEFNINSPKQLGEALFEKLMLPAKKKTKSGYSTDAKVLESLADKHPVVRDILEYRSLSKLKSTYCDGLLKVIAEDGRIHSTLNQTETRTGRISSTEPNLQNIPVRSQLGREMRKFFKAADGCTLVDADYSQIELRVLAHISGDKNMTEAFNSNTDIHTVTASEVFDMPQQLVTPLMRSRAKAVNFGIVYGIGAFSLAKDLGVSRAEADAYIKGYLNHYSGVEEYMERVVKETKEKGYADTIFARRRYLPEINASNGITRAFGERVARNMPIQGTAADIIKIAMIRVYEKLKEKNMNARLIMQVHDELIVECPENEREEVEKLLKEEMENAVKLNVSLIADVHSGTTWYEAKE